LAKAPNAPVHDRSPDDFATAFANAGFQVSVRRIGYDAFVPTAGIDVIIRSSRMLSTIRLSTNCSFVSSREVNKPQDRVANKSHLQEPRMSYQPVGGWKFPP
jgi:hypothetical protein